MNNQIHTIPTVHSDFSARNRGEGAQIYFKIYKIENTDQKIKISQDSRIWNVLDTFSISFSGRKSTIYFKLKSLHRLKPRGAKGNQKIIMKSNMTCEHWTACTTLTNWVVRRNSYKFEKGGMNPMTNIRLINSHDWQYFNNVNQIYNEINSFLSNLNILLFCDLKFATQR